MGHLIPAGSGFHIHKEVDVELTVEEPEPIIEADEAPGDEGDEIIESSSDDASGFFHSPLRASRLSSAPSTRCFAARVAPTYSRRVLSSFALRLRCSLR